MATVHAERTNVWLQDGLDGQRAARVRPQRVNADLVSGDLAGIEADEHLECHDAFARSQTGRSALARISSDAFSSTSSTVIRSIARLQ